MELVVWRAAALEIPHDIVIRQRSEQQRTVLALYATVRHIAPSCPLDDTFGMRFKKPPASAQPSIFESHFVRRSWSRIDVPSMPRFGGSVYPCLALMAWAKRATDKTWY